MIDLFASEVAGRPAIFLPEQVEVLADGGFLGYCFVLLFSDLSRSAKSFRKGDFIHYRSSLKSG